MSICIELRSRYAAAGCCRKLDPGEECFLGTSADINLTGDDLRARHVRIFLTEEGPYIEPVDKSPVAVNGKSISEATLLVNGDWLSLGSTVVHLRIVGPQLQQHFSKITCSPTLDRMFTVGRLQTCDLVIPSPLVSRCHATLHCRSGKTLIRDCSSTNGTYLNGKRAIGPVPLQRGDIVGFASFPFRFTGESLETVDEAGLVHVQAHKLCKVLRDRATGKPKQILNNISLVFKPGEFAAIFGMSGSGKSMLLDALNGQRPATCGQVLYNGFDLYSNLPSFRKGIGYVPQQDIVHRRILVHRALRYTARLRLARDTSSEEIWCHIERVLADVGLHEKALSPIDTPTPLSGGELKRVCLAVELIADPTILFLDEVTSGLDAGTDKRIMALLAQLASGPKTVICVTHTLENIHSCHLIGLLHHGWLAYFGPPDEARHYFGLTRLSEVYDLLERRPAEHWADQYLQSTLYNEYIEKRSLEMPPFEEEHQTGMVFSVMAGKTGPGPPQLCILMRRYLDILVSDRCNLALIALQAPFIGTLIGLVFSVSGPPRLRAVNESNVAFILVLSAIWCGCLNSTREVIKELPIYLRERSVNLRIGSYLLSKLIPLYMVCLLQSFALLGIATYLLSWSGDFWSRLTIVFLSAIAATGMGLTISTSVDSTDKAVTLVPILLIPQVIFSGAIVTLGKTGEMIARFTMISYSAFDAMKATMSEELAPFFFSQWTLTCNLATILGLHGIFLLTAIIGLKLKDFRRR